MNSLGSGVVHYRIVTSSDYDGRSNCIEMLIRLESYYEFTRTDVLFSFTDVWMSFTHLRHIE